MSERWPPSRQCECDELMMSLLAVAYQYPYRVMPIMKYIFLNKIHQREIINESFRCKEFTHKQAIIDITYGEIKSLHIINDVQFSYSQLFCKTGLN